jgi:serine/threonine-protein kinase
MTQAQRTLNNRYELVSKLGDGGMAVVFKALDHKLNRSVAVKVLRESFASDQQFLARFNREAQAAAALSHPNIVSVYDVGEDNNLHYIVMEYIEGQSLKDYITDNSPLSFTEAIEFTIQICNAIGYAHSKGLIHRDIKPQNILLTKNAEIKVTDFGIAKGLGDATLTQAGYTLGTVHYFSPEQAQGRPAVAQSDLYSIGIVLYEMLTGRIPFESDNPVALALKHIEEPPPSPRRFNPSVPAQLEQIVLKTLAKQPESRYPSAAAMSQALKDFATASEMGTQAVPSSSPSANRRPAARVEQDFPSPLPAAPRTQVDRPAFSNNYGQNRAPSYPPSVTPAGYQKGFNDNYYEQRPAPARGNRQSQQLYTNSGAAVEDDYYNEQPAKGGAGCVPWIIGTLLITMLAALVVLFVVFLIPNWTKPAPTATPAPPTPTAGPVAKVAMPDLKNKLLAEAEANLKDVGLQVGQTKTQFDDKVEAGRVISQSIPARNQVDKGSKVDLVISQGIDAVALPQKFVNTPYEDTKRAIESVGLKTQKVDQPSDTIGAGAVIRTDPEGGPDVKVPRNTVVKIFVSSGPLPTATPVPPTATPPPPTATATPRPQVTVPNNLIAKKEADVVKALQDLGLVVDVVRWNEQDIKTNFPGDAQALETWKNLKEGEVLGTNPPANTKVDKGSKVIIAVKKNNT